MEVTNSLLFAERQCVFTLGEEGCGLYTVVLQLKA